MRRSVSIGGTAAPGEISVGSPRFRSLPLLAAGPAREIEHSILCGEVEKVLVFELSFHADRIEVHVAGVAHLRLLPLGSRPQHHVGSPSTAEDHQTTAIDA